LKIVICNAKSLKSKLVILKMFKWFWKSKNQWLRLYSDLTTKLQHVYDNYLHNSWIILVVKADDWFSV
jgi:hypothetical protein